MRQGRCEGTLEALLHLHARQQMRQWEARINNRYFDQSCCHLLQLSHPCRAVLVICWASTADKGGGQGSRGGGQRCDFWGVGGGHMRTPGATSRTLLRPASVFCKAWQMPVSSAGSGSVDIWSAGSSFVDMCLDGSLKADVVAARSYPQRWSNASCIRSLLR